MEMATISFRKLLCLSYHEASSLVFLSFSIFLPGTLLLWGLRWLIQQAAADRHSYPRKELSQHPVSIVPTRKFCLSFFYTFKNIFLVPTMYQIKCLTQWRYSLKRKSFASAFILDLPPIHSPPILSFLRKKVSQVIPLWLNSSNDFFTKHNYLAWHGSSIYPSNQSFCPSPQ